MLVDWLPWHHTFGGNHNFNLVLRNGGTLYIDAGLPVAGQLDKTLANLADVAPTVFFNVPRAYDVLVKALQTDDVLRQKFFGRLQLLFYAAASLPQHLWEALSPCLRNGWPQSSNGVELGTDRNCSGGN